MSGVPVPGSNSDSGSIGSSRSRGLGLRGRLAALAAGLLLSAAAQAVEQVSLAEAASRLSTGGWILMMRHAATEPGVGDPANFRIGDCTTQRNLSAEGREQSKRIGAAMRAAGIRIDEVRNSQWCRCRETAELAFGASADWPALNSFFASRGEEPAQTARVVAWAAELGPRRNAMLVTHQVNISAAMGSFTAPGEIVAGRPREGRIEAAFRFTADQGPPR